MKNPIVAGIGQIAKDYIIAVDTYPGRGEKKRMERLVIDGGGPVSTALYTLAKFGITTRILSVIGDDPEGEYMVSTLSKVGVDTRYIVRRKDSSSHVAYIVVDKNGERTIFCGNSTCKHLSRKEFKIAFLDNVSLLHLDGFEDEISVFAAREAKRRQIPVMLDAGSPRRYMSRIIKFTDYLVTSSTFAKFYGFDGTFRKFKEIVKHFNRPHLTITMGDKGSITFHRGEFFKTQAFKVEAVDTTGAGDVFHGALIYALLKKFDIRKALRFASITAALKCRGYGGRSAIPDVKTVIRLM